jgi:hypothetical protein
MKSPQYLASQAILGGLALSLALATVAPSAHANVFASNIKINGGMTNVSVAQGTGVSISYILNEPASAGVTLKILSGGTVVRTVSIAGGNAGATRGTNTVIWDGKDNGNNPVAAGTYSVSVTAASNGFGGWTVTSDDNNEGNYSYFPQGIAVDRNTNSPYYGRVFLGNAWDNSANGTSPYFGDYVGIQKLNADGSYADEGGFSTGGLTWYGGAYAPWKIRVSDDDYVYIEDFSGAGVIYRFDGTISSNSMKSVFAAPSDYSLGQWSGFSLVGKGTNTVLWAADDNSPGSVGISKFFAKAEGTFNATAGTNVVAVGGSLDAAPYDVALDKNDNIYTVQNLVDSGNPAARVLRFPAYDPATNGGAPELTATWTVGAGNDEYAGANGVGVDPTGTYVAVACLGLYVGGAGYQNGSTTVLYATDGALVTNIDLNVSMTNQWTSDPTHHMDTACDWDNAGNLYYADAWAGVWRAVSPPGTNQATTFALPVVQVTGGSSGQPVNITRITVAGGVVTILFTAGPADTAGSFVLLGSSVATGPYAPAAGANFTQVGPGQFQATVPVSDSPQFYRIERSGSVSPPLNITSLSVASGTVTINFTGAASDSPSTLVLLSSATVNGVYSPAIGASIIQVSPGVFRATVPVNGPRQFYRVERSGSTPSPLNITSLSVANGTATVNFTGAASDSASALTLLSSSAADGQYSAAANAVIIQINPGVFRATVPTNGPRQFYRVSR